MQNNEIYCDIVVVLYLKYSKEIKGLKYIVVTLFALFWILYATPAILLSVPFIQRKVADIAVSELSNRLGVPVRIGKVNVDWFNRLVLDDLYLEDENGNVLFEANHVAGGFKILPLLKGKIVLTTIRLFSFSVNLKQNTPDDKLNLQFVLDAFASSDTTKQSPNIDLRINSVLIRKGNFRYDVLSESKTPDRFNPKHIEVKDISANISLKAFNKDSLNANIKKMSFKETSGFTLNKLALNVVGNRDSLRLENLEVKLPQTNFKVARANITLLQDTSITHIINHSPITLDIPSSQICLQDFSSFVPALGKFTDIIDLSATASGSVNDINLEQATIKYSDKMLFIGNMQLKGITHIEDAYVFGQVSKMYVTNEGLNRIINNFTKDPVVLPKPVVQLGTINFTGEISGFFDNLVAYGKLSTAIGSLQTDIIIGSDKDKQIATFLKGKISSSELKIHELFDENNPYGIARLDILIDAKRLVNADFGGNIKTQIHEFDYKGYRYENCLIAGNFEKNGFDGVVELNDPNGVLYANGMFRRQGKNSVFDFNARLDHFRPDNLNLSEQYESPDISGSISVNFTGNNIDNLEGNITIDSLAFNTTPSSFFLKKFRIEASGYSADRRLTISSDILNGEVVGAYSFTTLVPSFINTFKGYLPALVNATAKKKEIKENNFSLLLTIENTEAISETLKLPFTMVNQGRITGHYNNQYEKFRIEAFLPQFRIGKMMFESGYLTCENPSNKANLHLRATNYSNKGLKNYLDLKADAENNQINTFISWANNKERLFKADISASTLFSETKKEGGQTSLQTQIVLNKSSFVLNDSIWNLEQANINIREGRIAIDNFLVSRDNQHLQINGAVSKDPSDILYLDLNQVELAYIFDVVNIPVLQFGGKATGKFNINDVYGSRILDTDLKVEDFSFNQVDLGRLNLYSEWDDTQQGILMLGSIYKNDSTWTDVNGYIYPVGEKEGLSLYFDANDINVAFLQPFLINVAKDLKGRGSGNVRLYGPFSDISVEGKAYVMDGGLGVDFLNTYYTFSDTVFLHSNAIKFVNTTVYDKWGNTGKVNLTVNHNHFRDIDFHGDILAEKMLVYDATNKTNPLFYGSVFGSGTAQIKGNEKLVNLDINMQSAPKTALTFNFMGNNTATDYNFITFINKNKSDSLAIDSTSNKAQQAIALEEELTEVRVNMQLDVTPDANIELIMDPQAGDKIKGYGTGSMQIQYGTKSDLRMYGGFNILFGTYNFSLQQLIHRDFKIREGSLVNFRGDPLAANLDINAIYSVTTNIDDLDPQLSSDLSRRSIPVNCVLNVKGELDNPAISFDLELPGSNDDLIRKVKSMLDTEDMLTRQIVYLLVLNKFYTSDIYGTNKNDFNSAASSALSSQISSLLSSITDKVQIGTNIRTIDYGYKQEAEVEMLLSSQLLDNRLLFNGNFGYKNTAGMQNTFVGEFDLEYKLSRSGNIRLKAYNHANELYKYLSGTLYTQGIGIMYKRDFSTLSEIFRRKRKRLPSIVLPTDSIPETAP